MEGNESGMRCEVATWRKDYEYEYFEFSLAVMKFQYVSKGPNKNRNTLLGGAFTYYVDHWTSFLSSFIICSTIPLLPFLLLSSYILLLPTFIPQASFSLPTETS